ncbi:MAG: hypothetical protein A2048_05860 [Deltaproteobacteria bacterium GWA2_45_12]|nr:MAG: hypothetical protein A2048_05860 [Deltaproteobacteria bacterium GWA2_45_12]
MRAFLICVLGLWVFPLVVQACPVCFSAKGATLNAFRWSTLFLGMIPFIAFGAFFFWYRAKLKNRGL